MKAIMNTKRSGFWVRALGALGLAALLVGFVVLHGAQAPAKQPQPYTTWRAFGGTMDSMQYSALKQINKTNVNQLEQVWFYPAPAQGGPGRFSFSPLVVDNVMYVGGKDNRVIVALDAATGKEIWTHPTEGNPTDRGYAYWESKDRSDRRIIFSVNSYLQEIDARTGADHLVRQERPRRSERRAGSRRKAHPRRSKRHARTRFRKPDHPGRGDG